MVPLVATPPWNSGNGNKEQGNMYSYEQRTSEVAELHELTAEDQSAELRGDKLLELEGSR